MNILAFIVVLWGLASFGLASEPDTKPNPAIEKAIASALSDATKSYGAYQEILAKATDRAVKDLEKLKSEAMKKGDLPLAVAVDAHIKELKEGALGDRVAEKAREKEKDSGDLLGDAIKKKSGVAIDPKDPLIGRWKNTDNPSFERSYVFVKDGTGLGDNYWKFTWKPRGESGYILVYLPDPNMKGNPERIVEWGEVGISFTVPEKGPFVFTRVEEKPVKGAK